MTAAHKRLDCVKLAAALGFDSEWVVRGVKKANRLLHKQGKEPLIFTGRYSTPAKVSRWLDEHQEFVATHYLAPQRRKKKQQQQKKGQEGSPAQSAAPKHQPVSAAGTPCE